MSLIHSKKPSRAAEKMKMSDGGEVDSETEVIPDKGWGKIIVVGNSEGGEVEDPNKEFEEDGTPGLGERNPDLKIDTEFDAEGGEVGGNDDDDLDDAMGEEFMNAVHSKDKKAIMSSLQAIALSIKNRSK